MSLAATLPYDHPYAGGYPGIGSQPLPTDTDALDYLSRVKAADGAGVEVGVATAVSAFFRDTKAAGVFDALKACCILAGARTLAGALIPVVGDTPTNVADNFVESDYSRTAGLTGDGATTSIDSNRANDDDPQNDNHNAIYITSANTNDPAVYMGSDGSGTAGYNQLVIASVSGAGEFISACRNASGTFNGISGGANKTGFHGISRSLSSEYLARVEETTTTHSQASVTSSSANVHVFARGPTPAVFTDATIAFYSIGTSVDLEALDTAVTDLITAIGEAL